uniref:Iron-sulfur cluster assembly enzyme a n=1 Tax=Cynoglossus semilaevis TaxID=244447 RepID=A0A3P8WGV2_CYNSE
GISKRHLPEIFLKIYASPSPASLLSTVVLDHYENPRNVGSLNKSSKNVGTVLVCAPACGDVMKPKLQVDENGKIVDAKFQTFACGSAIASSSLATEWVKGKSIDEALKIKTTDICKFFFLLFILLFLKKKIISVLAEDAIKAALSDYRLKQKDKKENHVKANS